MNRGSYSILSVFSDARAEFTKQLFFFPVTAFFQFFTELLEKAKQSMINEPKRALWQFQNYLNEIHDWNIQKVTSEINIINTNCGCDYLDDLLTAVFIAHTKVLTAIRLSSNNKKVEINIPKVEHFSFKDLCETAKLLWSSTYLFREGIPGIEKQQNYRMIEQLINEGILQAVRGLVPVKSILKDFVNGGADEEEEDSDNETETQEALPIQHITEKEEEKPKLETVPQEITIPQPVVLSDTPVIVNEKPTEQPVVMETPLKNEVIKPQVETTPQVQAPQTIIIDEKPSVRFGEFDAVFDSDHPMNSEMIYDPKDGDDEVPALEIMEGDGKPLADGIDFDDLEGGGDKSEEIGAGEYEEL